MFCSMLLKNYPDGGVKFFNFLTALDEKTANNFLSIAEIGEL